VGDLPRASQRAVGLVEELQALVALALGQVRAVGGEQRHRRDEQERKRMRIGGGDHRPAQSEAGVARGDHEVHAEHAHERGKPDESL
jgi:hypothetical protein